MQIPARYQEEHDKYLFDLRNAMAEQEAEDARQAMKFAHESDLAQIRANTSRYNARLGLLGALAAQEAGLTRADIESATNLAVAERRSQDAALDRASREALAAANRRLEQWKIRVMSRGTPKDHANLRRQIASEFMRWWIGKPGVKGIGPNGEDVILPGTATGGAALRRTNKKHAARVALSYVLGLGADYDLAVQLLSPHFSKAELQYAARFVS
jgi:hypothetical protein